MIRLILVEDILLVLCDVQEEKIAEKIDLLCTTELPHLMVLSYSRKVLRVMIVDGYAANLNSKKWNLPG